MKIENQVVSLNLARRLRELNVPDISYFQWVLTQKEEWELWDEGMYSERHNGKEKEFISAYSVAELANILPDSQRIRLPWKFDNKWYSDTFINCPCDKEADARAKLIIHLLENNLLNAGDIRV